MRTLAEEFREVRRVSTPWCVIQTSDFRAVIKELIAVRYNGEADPPIVVWDAANGPVSHSGDVALGSADDPPFIILKNALTGLPPEGILFWVVPDDTATPNNFWHMFGGQLAQAVANVRDHFKTDRRTLVILSIDGKLPALITDDVPLLRDPLPDEKQLVGIADGLVSTINKRRDEDGKKPLKIEKADIVRAGSMCRGMTRFSAEDAISRHIGAQGMALDNLSQAQRLVIEQSSERVLTFERGTETFSDIGGLDQIKKFSTRLFSGERPPTVIIRIEEIEKAMAGSDSEMGDTSGTSQDQLGVMLQRMEDNDWSGLIAYGVPGSGKSLVSKAMGNSNNVITLNLDLGAAKGQYVGTSEHKVRKAMDIIFSVGDKNVFFVATANGLRVIPQALRRRFRFGIWAFSIPTPQERRAIWSINLKRYGLDAEQPKPEDHDFTGSDIRNVCDLAFRLRCPLTEAVEYIVPVAKSDPGAVERFQNEAHGKFLSASQPGVYKKPEAQTSRKISV